MTTDGILLFKNNSSLQHSCLEKFMDKGAWQSTVCGVAKSWTWLTLLSTGSPGTPAGKESTCNAGGPCWIPGSGRSPEEGIGYSLQHSCASLISTHSLIAWFPHLPTIYWWLSCSRMYASVRYGPPQWLSPWKSLLLTGCNAGDTGAMGLIRGSGRSPGGGNGNPLQHSCLKNPMTEKPGNLFPKNCKESDVTEQLNTCAHTWKNSWYCP